MLQCLLTSTPGVMCLTHMREKIPGCMELQIPSTMDPYKGQDGNRVKKMRKGGGKGAFSTKLHTSDRKLKTRLSFLAARIIQNKKPAG